MTFFNYWRCSRELALNLRGAEEKCLAEKVFGSKFAPRYKRRTLRECEVFALMVGGLLNKQIADVLGTTERTIKAHRAQVTHKMGGG